MSTRRISISQLRKGMFVHELDIPWMKSPFLRHRRKIDTHNDVVLLKKAGVMELSIDLSRGDDILDNTQTSPVEEPVDQPKDKSIPTPPAETTFAKTAGPEESSNHQHPPEASTEEKSPLNEELKVAKILQGKIEKLVNQLSSLVKEGRPLSIETMNPVIDEARKSLYRNDQALMTMLHLHRQDIKLSDHSFGVFAVVLPLAMRLDCTDDEINELGLAALLHDTGWSRLPMHLLGKNKPYTVPERRLIEQHPGIIENVLNKSQDFPDSVKLMVKQHHELSDGSGYPDKLKKQATHKLVEILQVADSYDECIHGLTDKPGMLPANALKLLYQAGKKGLYSETVVSKLIHVMSIYPLTSAVRLNSSEKGVVVEIDKQKPLQPKVNIMYEANGKPCGYEKIVDLGNQEQGVILTITEVIDPLDKKEDPLGLLRVIDVQVAS